LQSAKSMCSPIDIQKKCLQKTSDYGFWYMLKKLWCLILSIALSYELWILHFYN
jgi:hypothetical protein